MGKAIAVLNAGSSSLKFSIYAVAGWQLRLLARGQIEGVGTSPRFKAKDENGNTLADGSLNEGTGFGHPQAFVYVSSWIKQQFADEYSLLGIGHRVVHGGARFTAPTIITADVLKEVEKLVPLMPLHLPANLSAVKAVMELRPDLPQVACFDTAFHQGREKVTQRLGLPDEYFQQGVRRWGFHGLSYESISTQLITTAPELARGRTIVAHLGSGASMCAMHGGKSVDTTMSFSALDGLPMGTRCGSLDPGVVLYLLQRGMTASQIEDMLYKKSGLLGISGISNDVRDLLASDQPPARQAIDYFVYRIIREVGSLAAALGGLDGLVFTAGVGENSPLIRRRVCEGLRWLGIELDLVANEQQQRQISPAAQKPSVWVIPTDEELVIARHTQAAISAVAK